MSNADCDPSGNSVRGDDEPPASVHDADPDELLALLGDDYTQAILSILGNDSLCAREIATRADISSPTVYRRLNRLVDAGVIETGIGIRPSGHHRKQFRITTHALDVRLDGELDVVGEDDARPSGESTGSPPRAPMK